MDFKVILAPRAIQEIIHNSNRIVYRVNNQERRNEVSRSWHGARGTPGS